MGFGPGEGLPNGGSFSGTLNWLTHRDGPKDQRENFLGGWGNSMSGGYWGGLQYSWSADPTNKTTAWGVGVVKPGGGLSRTLNIKPGTIPVKW